MSEKMVRKPGSNRGFRQGYGKWGADLRMMTTLSGQAPNMIGFLWPTANIRS